MAAEIVVRLDVMLARRKRRARDVAAEIGMTEANFSLLKSGKVKGVRFETLAKLCEALDCTPGDLLDVQQVDGVAPVEWAVAGAPMRLFLAVTLGFSLACAAGKPDEDGTSEVDDSTAGGDDAIEGDDGGECRDGADNDQDGAFDCDDDGCAGSPDCDVEGEFPPVLSLQADADTVSVRITDRSGDFEIGFAETSGSDPWTGEDCLDGYTLGGGDHILVCHAVDAGSRDLRVVDNPYDVIDGYTLFSEDLLLDAAIVVIDVDSDECWANHRYFDALGCDALTVD